MSKVQLKAAIYTRKSTEHGLDQEFNSLVAQREAGEAYVKSQRSEGWVLVSKSYDDGGISGATMQRPALQALLSDIEDGNVDIIIVYKVDRLTRSLSDFARIIERLDTAGASFVSVTQQFNTSSSMGRLTLNVLLSFAQFEREVTAERIRDKIDASRKKGMWMGGVVPLGYDNKDKKLIINKAESKTVTAIFEGYLKTANMHSLKDKLKSSGLMANKQAGHKSKTHSLSPGPLYYILNNPLYIGDVVHKGERYFGEHEAIIESDLWDRVQDKLKDGRVKGALYTNVKYPSLLIGLLFDLKDNRYTPSHSNKRGKRYRYYILTSPKNSGDVMRFPATGVEDAVKNSLINWLLDENPQTDSALNNIPEDSIEPITPNSSGELCSIINTLKQGTPHAQRALFIELLDKVQIYKGGMHIWINRDALPDKTHTAENAIYKLEVKTNIKHQLKGTNILIPAGQQILQKPDQTLIRLIANAHLWSSDLRSGNFTNMTELADKHCVNKSDLGKIARLAYLAPDIINAIMEGRQPPSLKANTLRKLSDLPADWNEQRKMLGFI